MKKGSTRRDVLKGLAAVAGGAAFAGGATSLLPTALAQGGGTADRYYVFCYFSGGWDVLLSLDPRDPVQYSAGNVSATRILPGYEFLESTTLGPFIDPGTGIMFGPHIGDLADHADKLCIVRGMSMETLTHEAGMRRFLTGQPPSGLLARGSSGATWLASALGNGDPIPNLAVNVESYNTHLPKYATGLEVGAVPDLIRVLRPGEPALDPRIEQQLSMFLAQESACTNPRRSALWQAAEASRLQAIDFSTQGLDDMFDFQADTPAMEILRDHYDIAATGSTALSSPAAQAAIAARALMGGVSRCVSIQVASGLDTHYEQEWTEDQGPIQEAGFDAIARLVEDLAQTEYKASGDSWLDKTTIIGFSEFCRTAMLNDRGGRDHSLTNSCFLLGADIKGGTVVGESSNRGMSPVAVDLNTGLTLAQGGQAVEVVRPEHVWQALYDRAGINDSQPDAADLRVSPLNAIIA